MNDPTAALPQAAVRCFLTIMSNARRVPTFNFQWADMAILSGLPSELSALDTLLDAKLIVWSETFGWVPTEAGLELIGADGGR